MPDPHLLLAAAGWEPVDADLDAPAYYRDPHRPDDVLPLAAAHRRALADDPWLPAALCAGYERAADGAPHPTRGTRRWWRADPRSVLTDAEVIFALAGWHLDALHDPERDPHWRSPHGGVSLPELAALPVASHTVAAAHAERVARAEGSRRGLRSIAGGATGSSGRQSPAGGESGGGSAA